MTVHVITHGNREAWLAARSADRGVIGCSDLAAILGVSRFRGPWDLYARHVLGLPEKPDAGRDADRRRGLALEGYVLSEYAARTGYRLTGAGEYLSVSNPAIPWLRGSPDALVEAVDGDEGIVDAKVSRDAWEWATDGSEIEAWSEFAASMLPPDMALQGYGLMALTGRAWCDFAIMLPFFEIRHVRLHRDERVIASMLETAGRLVEHHLAQGHPPDIDASESCRRAVQARWEAGRQHADEARTPREASPEQAARLREYADAYDAAKAAADAKALAQNRLRDALQGAAKVRHEHLTINDGAAGMRLTRRTP